MIDPNNIIIVFTAFSLIAFAFSFWRDSKNEGFSSDRILDAYFTILLGAILGGKLLFRTIDLDYFRYEIIRSPLILEGVLVGGGIATWINVKRNKWAGWKIGDMIAPALSLFQAIVFWGFYLADRRTSSLFIFISFLLLYLFIRYLKYSKNFGSSVKFIERKRMNQFMFTGVLLVVYLTVSSLIAILFLGTNINFFSWLWRFQVIFYFLVFVVSLVLFVRQVNRYNKNMNNKFLDKINLMDFLKNRKKKISIEEEKLKKQDPFIKEYENDGTRLDTAIEDEVSEQMSHKEVATMADIIDEEKKEIDGTIGKISKGDYGICEKCNKPISKERLAIYPTAKYCINCEREAEK